MRAETAIALAFLTSLAASVALAVVYLVEGGPQAEGVLLAIALTGLGTGLIVWARRLMDGSDHVEERPPLASRADERAAFATELEGGGEASPGRRRLLLSLLAAALGGLGLAAIFPIRSLGPRPGDALLHTAWRPGLRLVDDRGEPVSIDTLTDGGIITAWPEGALGRADSSIVVVRVAPTEIRLSAERTGWAPEGHIAYSKVCTHAGCPVGLFEQETRILICPCHQSGFDALEGARPVFGPAARPLPQLPLGIDDAGHLVATGDLSSPAGVGFWRLPE